MSRDVRVPMGDFGGDNRAGVEGTLHRISGKPRPASQPASVVGHGAVTACLGSARRLHSECTLPRHATLLPLTSTLCPTIACLPCLLLLLLLQRSATARATLWG